MGIRLKIRSHAMAIGIGATMLGFGATSAGAELRVVASIAPLHSLTAQVMEGVGEPELLMPAGASPHHFAMRPSEAKALQQADVVFWVGPAIEGWMSRPLISLGKLESSPPLGEADGVLRLPLRIGGGWEAHDHDHADHEDHDDHDEHAKHDDHDDHAEHAEHDDHDDHAEHAKHDDHDDHAEHAEHGDHDDHADHDDHDEHAKHDDHDDHDEHADHHDHDHAESKYDAHVWLDPRNAKVWVETIAATLGKADPSNAAAYQENAAKALRELDALEQEISAELAQAKALPYVVFHDAYQYFEQRFDLNAVGSISLPDASDPGPKRLAEVRDKIRSTEARCVFTEPQFPQKMALRVIEGSDAKVGVLDPLGASIEPGPGHYPATIRALSRGLLECLQKD